MESIEKRSQVHTNRVFTIPNLISFFRLAMVPVFAVLVFQEYMVAALVVLAVSGFTDWLDGVVARALHQVSELGKALDPAADRLFIFATLLGLMWHSIIPWQLVVIIIARELTLLALVPVLWKSGKKLLPVNYIGKIATFCLLYAFPLLLLAEFEVTVAELAYMLGWIFASVGVLCYWVSAVMYVRQALILAKSGKNDSLGKSDVSDHDGA